MAFWSGEWWIAVMVLAIAFIIWAIWYQVHTHTKGILGEGRELGLTQVTIPKTFIQSVEKTTYLFSRGRGKFIRLALEGDFDESFVRFFDYHYKIGFFLHSLPYKQSVAAFPVEEDQFPIFHLRPASSVEKLATKLGYPTIKFDSHPKFSSPYLLQGPAESAIRMLFLPPLLDTFESLLKEKWHIDSSGDWLFLYVHRRLVEGDQLGIFLDDASQIAKTIFARGR
jgi:hypothetical protein